MLTLIVVLAFGVRSPQPEGPAQPDPLIESEVSEIFPGLTRVALPAVNGSPVLTIFPAPESACFMGDVDVMRSELARDPGAKLLMSLEIMGDLTRAPLFFRAITVEELLTARPIALMLPRTEKLEAAALFLCKDSRKGVRCQDLPPVNFRDAEMRYGASVFASASVRVGSEPPPDSSYTFLPVMLRGDGAFMVTGDTFHTITEPLTHFLDTQGLGGCAGEYVSAVSGLNASLNTPPVKLRSGQVVLKLPYFSRAACKPREKAIP